MTIELFSFGDSAAHFICSYCGACEWIDVTDEDVNPDPKCAQCGYKASQYGRWVGGKKPEVIK